MDWSLLQQLGSIIFGVAATVATITWFFSRQLNALSERFFTKLDAAFDKINTKLEYHEQHDDQRFSDLNNNVWELRLRQAVVDNKGTFSDQEKNTARSYRRNKAREKGEMSIS